MLCMLRRSLTRPVVPDCWSAAIRICNADGVGPVAVVCAMGWELAHLRALLPDDSKVALAASGMGMTNAAQKAESIVRRERPRAVLNYGCAGAHREDVLLGDLVIATRVV